MSKRVDRSKEEVAGALQEQVSLLRLACDNFDAGAVVAARNMAAQLRTLLWQPSSGRAQSKALLAQVTMPRQFLSLAFSISEKRLSILQGPGVGRGPGIPSCGLVHAIVASDGASFFAPLDEVRPVNRRWLPFAEWVSTPVLRDYRGHEFSRMDLIKHVADTDGGAHVDLGLDLGYAEVKTGISLGWRVEATGTYVKDLEAHCLRQISHEVLSTLRRSHGWALGAPLPHPSIPKVRTGARIGDSIAIRRGLRMQCGEFVLVIDGDSPSPERADALPNS